MQSDTPHSEQDPVPGEQAAAPGEQDAMPGSAAPQGSPPTRLWQRLQGWIRQLWILPIRFYQLVISPWLPPSCIYSPSCSEYTRRAILRHGLLRGVAIGILRIGRCIGSLYTGGTDPVPHTIRWPDIFRQFKQRWRWRRS
ncbi:membrane protein insertion efficiency factor YidD [Spirochaeta africana]|uniref:Putative membrane protein insertion efficiency factor n=1 Tax=Spirochaeta africana (strain ATCC 700263 / DSM 8902 / Z-7692) TaxID=889378 RepID=H9UFX8_SPIAZ|nr:membrane protein insertion efficiency factor YidD [Spirochaeta africana]AFG36421.1 hypothetical protein Spiaf_0313 [Spirochaeta africana DSM 8902]